MSSGRACCGAGGLSQPGDHPGHALPAGWRQRFPDAHPRRRAEDPPQPDHRGAERQRRRRGGGLDAGGQGQARRLHAAAEPYRHVDDPAALQEVRFRSAAGLRVHRPVRRGAHGHAGGQGLRAEDLRRGRGLCEGEEGEAHHGLVGHGQRHASLRHAVPGGAGRAGDDGAVQGRGPGGDRRAFGPGRPDLRPRRAWCAAATSRPMC